MSHLNSKHAMRTYAEGKMNVIVSQCCTCLVSVCTRHVYKTMLLMPRPLLHASTVVTERKKNAARLLQRLLNLVYARKRVAASSQTSALEASIENMP
jgi:hypothetical protein